MSRASGCCEYCLLPQSVSFFNFHIDHIRSIKHGGNSEISNLAYCCPDCNFYKGSDLGTVLDTDDVVVRFFNPRKDKWLEHFSIENGSIIPRSEIGESTIRIFQLNEPDRLIFRQQLIDLGIYTIIKT